MAENPSVANTTGTPDPIPTRGMEGTSAKISHEMSSLTGK